MDLKLAENGTRTGGKTTNGQKNGKERQHIIYALIASGISMRKREVQRCQSQLVSSDCTFSLVPFFYRGCYFWQFRVQTVASAMIVTRV